MKELREYIRQVLLEANKRKPRKKGQRRNSPSHSDLYTDENPKGTIKGLKFATVKDAKASVSKIKRSGKTHAHKIQAAVAMEQRAKVAGKKSAAGVYRSYINSQKNESLQRCSEPVVSSVPSVEISPPPEDSIHELQEVMNQYRNRYNPEELQEACDTDMESLFLAVVSPLGHEVTREHINGLKLKHMQTITDLKDTYRRRRPDQLAEDLGVDWSGDGIRMDTDDTFSYPSGHTCQAYYIALKLIEQFPELAKELISVAEMVAQSRVDRGVHFPSDLDAGRELAVKLYNMGL